jgi:cell division protein FtsN
MGYQFSFTKTRFFLVVLLCLLAAGLIFVGGVATGKRIAASDDEPAAASPTTGGPKLNAKQLALAKSVVKVPAIPSVVPGQAALITAATAPSASPAAAAGAPAPASPTPGAPVTPTTQPVATAPAAPDASAAATAPVPVAVAVAVANPADRPYVLQVGAFRDTKPAKDLQADLLKKGYSTTIYNMVDEDLGSWHMVRFGGYKDVSTASKAASDFTAKEGVQALVKRFDAL